MLARMRAPSTTPVWRKPTELWEPKTNSVTDVVKMNVPSAMLKVTGLMMFVFVTTFLFGSVPVVSRVKSIRFHWMTSVVAPNRPWSQPFPSRSLSQLAFTATGGSGPGTQTTGLPLQTASGSQVNPAVKVCSPGKLDVQVTQRGWPFVMLRFWTFGASGPPRTVKKIPAAEITSAWFVPEMQTVIGAPVTSFADTRPPGSLGKKSSGTPWTNVASSTSGGLTISQG